MTESISIREIVYSYYLEDSWKFKKEQVHVRLEENRQNRVPVHKHYTPKTFIQSLLAGGASGCIAKSCIAPLERTKILFQVGCFRSRVPLQVSNKPFTLRLAAKKIAQVYREEGITRLWKGNSATVLRVIPYSATQFAAFRGYSNLIMVDEYTPLTPLQRFFAGAGAGATATSLTYPFDFLRTRMAVKEGDATYRNIIQAIRCIIKQEVGMMVCLYTRGFLLFTQESTPLFLVFCLIQASHGWFSTRVVNSFRII